MTSTSDRRTGATASDRPPQVVRRGQDTGSRPEPAPGNRAQKPQEIPAKGWKDVLKRAFKESGNDNVNLLAAGVAFYSFLAIFPAIIAAVTVYGLVADPGQVQQQLQSVAGGLPEGARSVLLDQAETIASQPSSGLGFGLAVALAAALWSASAGTSGLIQAVNVCYDEGNDRGFVKKKALALLLTLGAVVFVVVAIGLIAVLPPVLDALALGGVATFLVQVLRWVGLVLAFMVALAVIYRLAPDRDAPKFRWVGVGAVTTTLLWIVASAGFAFYANNFGSYGATYGALAGVVILLFWLFITAYLILLGAEINSESELQTTRDTTKGEERPMGERDAVKADNVPPADRDDE